MTPENGYSWIIDEKSYNQLNMYYSSYISNIAGVFSIAAREGYGPSYDSFLQKWKNATVTSQ